MLRASPLILGVFLQALSRVHPALIAFENRIIPAKQT